MPFSGFQGSISYRSKVNSHASIHPKKRWGGSEKIRSCLRELILSSRSMIKDLDCLGRGLCRQRVDFRLEIARGMVSSQQRLTYSLRRVISSPRELISDLRGLISGDRGYIIGLRRLIWGLSPEGGWTDSTSRTERGRIY